MEFAIICYLRGTLYTTATALSLPCLVCASCSLGAGPRHDYCGGLGRFVMIRHAVIKLGPVTYYKCLYTLIHTPCMLHDHVMLRVLLWSVINSVVWCYYYIYVLLLYIVAISMDFILPYCMRG